MRTLLGYLTGWLMSGAVVEINGTPPKQKPYVSPVADKPMVCSWPYTQDWGDGRTRWFVNRIYLVDEKYGHYMLQDRDGRCCYIGDAAVRALRLDAGFWWHDYAEFVADTGYDQLAQFYGGEPRTMEQLQQAAREALEKGWSGERRRV